MEYDLWVVIKENISFLSSCGRINRGPLSSGRGEVVGDVDRGGGKTSLPFVDDDVDGGDGGDGGGDGTKNL